MATILEFPNRPVAGAVTRKAAKRGARSAQIVIFPGVRIERWEEPAMIGKAPRKRARVSCDMLELQD